MSQDILVSDIRPDPGQPRKDFDEEKLFGLARSLKRQGQSVPITVRPAPGEETQSEEGSAYVIVAGERRWRAARRLGWDQVRAEVKDVSPDQARWLALTENLQREALSPVEEARAFDQLLAQEGLTQRQLAEEVGVSQSYIAQKLRLLGAPPPVSFWAGEDLLSEAHVRQLLRIRGFFLEGATISYDLNHLEKVGSPEEGHQLLLQERPTSQILCAPQLEEAKNLKCLEPAANSLIRYIREEGQPVQDGCRAVPSWVVAAWHYGGAACACGMNASELSEAIGKLETTIRNQYVWFASFRAEGEKPVPPRVQFEPNSLGIDPSWGEASRPVSELTRPEVFQAFRFIRHWSSEGDLSRAGLLEALKETCSQQRGTEEDTSLSSSQIEANLDLIEESREQVGDSRFPPPTEAQSEKAPTGAAWSQLAGRLEELEKESGGDGAF